MKALNVGVFKIKLASNYREIPRNVAEGLTPLAQILKWRQMVRRNDLITPRTRRYLEKSIPRPGRQIMTARLRNTLISRLFVNRTVRVYDYPFRSKSVRRCFAYRKKKRNFFFCFEFPSLR